MTGEDDETLGNEHHTLGSTGEVDEGQVAVVESVHVRLVHVPDGLDSRLLVKGEAGAVVASTQEVGQDCGVKAGRMLLTRDPPSLRLAEHSDLLNERHVSPVRLRESLNHFPGARRSACKQSRHIL